MKEEKRVEEGDKRLRKAETDVVTRSKNNYSEFAIGLRRANVVYYLSILMSAQKRGRDVSPATRGAIAYARYQNRSPLRVIQARTGVPLSTISDICNHAYKQAKIHETEPFRGENTASGSHSGRPSMLCQEEIDKMIKLVTSSYR